MTLLQKEVRLSMLINNSDILFNCVYTSIYIYLNLTLDSDNNHRVKMKLELLSERLCHI